MEAFEKLGVDMTYLDADTLSGYLRDWTQFGEAVTTTFAAACFVVVLMRIVLVKPTSTSMWTGLRVVVLGGYLVMHFVLWVGPSMQYDFANSIAIDRSNISNTTLEASSEMLSAWKVETLWRVCHDALS